MGALLFIVGLLSGILLTYGVTVRHYERMLAERREQAEALLFMRAMAAGLAQLEKELAQEARENEVATRAANTPE